MPGIDFDTVLTRLLSDRSLLARFRQDPHALCNEWGVDAHVRADLLALDGEALDAQAQTLLQKRWHAVASLLPQTLARGGATTETIFMRYAASSWPAGHQRHACDAHEFCRYLREHGYPLEQAEFNRLQFGLSPRHLALYMIPRTGDWRIVQLLFRWRGALREIHLYLALR